MVGAKELNFLASIAENLRRIRTERGLTQAQVAERCGMDLRTVQRLESGTYNARLNALGLLCVGLELSAAELVSPTATAPPRKAGRGRPRKAVSVKPKLRE